MRSGVAPQIRLRPGCISQRDKIATTLDKVTTSPWGFRCRATAWLGVAPWVPVVSTGKHRLTHGNQTKHECTLLFEPNDQDSVGAY